MGQRPMTGADAIDVGAARVHSLIWIMGRIVRRRAPGAQGYRIWNIFPRVVTLNLFQGLFRLLICR